MTHYVIYKKSNNSILSFLSGDVTAQELESHVSSMPGYAISTNKVDIDTSDPLNLARISIENGMAIVLDAPKIVDQDALDLREIRDRLLAETDWWAVSDRTMTEEQVAYRQALRDLPQKYSGLSTAVIPVKP